MTDNNVCDVCLVQEVIAKSSLPIPANVKVSFNQYWALKGPTYLRYHPREAVARETWNAAFVAQMLKLGWRFSLGDTVRKTKGSQWQGKVVGFYSTELTPEGYAVESSTEKGSVQIYPATALELVGASK